MVYRLNVWGASASIGEMRKQSGSTKAEYVELAQVDCDKPEFMLYDNGGKIQARSLDNVANFMKTLRERKDVVCERIGRGWAPRHWQENGCTLTVNSKSNAKKTVLRLMDLHQRISPLLDLAATVCSQVKSGLLDVAVNVRICGFDDEKDREWLEARKKAGMNIDPDTAEVTCAYVQMLDPYGILRHLPPECHSFGREWFARAPGSDIWVLADDLPVATRAALRAKHSTNTKNKS